MQEISLSEIAALRPRIYGYMGYVGTASDIQTDNMITECIRELERTAQFNYIYKYSEELPPFLEKEPYRSYLEGSRGVIICAMTLGIAVDRIINRLLRISPSKGAVMNACAGAYLEYLCDTYEERFGSDRGARFCPGYGGSRTEDLKYIFEILDTHKIGIVLNENYFMLPSKSMAGIIAIGGNARAGCGSCIMAGSCAYLKEGAKCFTQGKK